MIILIPLAPCLYSRNRICDLGVKISLTLCSSFINQSIKTWDWLKSSNLTRIKISEESITDFNLLELTLNNPHEIVTDQISRNRESRIGADWEWWLTSNSDWLGLRVQAKKLDSATLTYPELDHQNRYGLQVQQLIYHAINNNPPLIPIYVFYNYWDMTLFNPVWKCPSYPKRIEMLGCSFSHAEQIRRIILNRSKNLLDVDKSMYPWSCLVCCRGFSNKDANLPERAFNFIHKAFKLPDLKSQNYIIKDAPWYVYKILEKQSLTDKEWEKLGLRRITVIQEMKNPLYSDF